MERCCGQAAMVHADHVNSWWGVELLIPLLKHTKYYYFCELSMCRPMPTRGKWLEGFHIHAAYRMAQEHKPRKGLFGNWIYPSTKDVLEECGLHSMKEYITTRRATIAMYVVNRPIFRECQEGERRRGSMPRRWWWEQELGLDV